MKSRYLFYGVLSCTAVLLLSGCVGFQERVDNNSVRDYAQSLVERYDGQSPHELMVFLGQAAAPWQGGGSDRPDDLTVSIGAARSVEHPQGQEIVQSTLSFTSAFSSGDETVDRAQFFIYHTGSADLSGRRAVLWLPGMGFSDLALRFVDRFFDAILEAGYVLVVYIPPYHLTRLPDDKQNSELLHPDVQESLSRVNAMTGEIITAYRWLESEGVATIGAWGGSIGAALAMMAGHAVDFDHLAVMIPVIDFRTLIPLHPEMNEYFARAAADGLTSDLLLAAYRTISPVAYDLPVPPERVLILAARYDQLIPLPVISAYARAHRITEFYTYSTSHATILLEGQMYERYRQWLQQLPLLELSN